MHDYAVSLGAPSNHIILEEDSLDTLGNAYFSKTAVLERRDWHRIIVVSSPDHMVRTRYIFDRVLGPGYIISYVNAPTVLKGEALQAKLTQEVKSLLGIQKMLSGVPVGDNQKVFQVLKYYFPGYTRNTKQAWAHLHRLVAEVDNRS